MVSGCTLTEARAGATVESSARVSATASIQAKRYIAGRNQYLSVIMIGPLSGIGIDEFALADRARNGIWRPVAS